MASPTEIAGKAVGKFKGMKEAATGGQGICQRLATEHGEVSTLIARVRATGDASDVRKELYGRIRDELRAHARAEEAIFYYALRGVPELTEKLEGSTDEHHQIEAFLDRLDMLSIEDPHWIEVFQDMAEVVTHHVQEEEGEVFEMAKKALGPQASKILEELYLRAKARELDALT